MLVAIDPGLRAAGVARFEDELLVACDCVREDYGEGPTQWTAMAAAVSEWIGDDVDELAIEYMVTRPDRSDVHDDLIQLSQVSGGIYALVGAETTVAVPPSNWTKNRPKRVNHRRVRKRLNEAETAVLEHALAGVYKTNRKEVLDAVGIGLYLLDRLG